MTRTTVAALTVLATACVPRPLEPQGPGEAKPTMIVSTVHEVAPTRELIPDDGDHAANSRQVIVQIVRPDGAPYVGPLHWCFVSETPPCPEYDTCHETDVIGRFWIDLPPVENCALEAMAGRLSVIPTDCWSPVDSDRETGDAYQVVLGQKPTAIVLTPAEFGGPQCPRAQ